MPRLPASNRTSPLTSFSRSDSTPFTSIFKDFGVPTWSIGMNCNGSASVRIVVAIFLALYQLAYLVSEQSERNLAAVWLAAQQGFAKVRRLFQRDFGRHRWLERIHHDFDHARTPGRERLLEGRLQIGGIFDRKSQAAARLCVF